MTSRLLHDSAGLRTFALVFETGDDALQGLQQFAREHRITGAQLTAIGAFSRVVLGYFDWSRKDYERITLAEQVEVLTLAGNIGEAPAPDQGNAVKPALHAHVVVGRVDGTAYGGHLLEATVRPTLEVVVIETPQHLRRRFNPETGLNLIDLSI